MLRDRSAEAGSSETMAEPGGGAGRSTLTIDVGEREGRTCVTLSGELDGASVPPLREQLVDLTGTIAGDLVLDIGGLSFLDSTALTLLVVLHKRLSSTGQQLILSHPTPMAVRLFQITGLDSVLRTEPSSAP
jgi:anti-sigma B factor antagonist